MSFPGYELYFSQSFVEGLGLPSSLQFDVTPVDLAGPSNDTDTDGTSQDIYATHVLGGMVPSSNPDPNCTSSMNGQLSFPGVESHGPGYDSPSAHQSYEQPAQYDQGPCSIPLGSDTDVLPLTSYFDTSQVEYVDQSVYHTDWGLQTRQSANSQNRLPTYHVDTETLNCNVSQVGVRQILEEPGFLPTSGYESVQYSERYLNPPRYNIVAQGCDPVAYFPRSSDPTTTTTDIPPALYSSHTPSSFHPPYPVFLTNQTFPLGTTPPDSYQVQQASAPDIQLTTIGRETVLQAPHSYNSLPSSFTFNSTSYPVFPTDYAVPPAASAPALYPSQHDTQAQYWPTTIPSYPVLAPRPGIPQATSTGVIPPTTYPNSLPSSSSSSPITPLDAIPLPAPHPTLKRVHSSPSLPPTKHPKTSKKPAVVPKTSEKPDKSKSPGCWAKVRSQDWIHKFFPNKGACILCVEDDGSYLVPGPRKGKPFTRDDRRLEHLVSTHIFQKIKNKRTFGNDVSEHVTSLVKTQAQFVYARQQLDQIKCSICPTDTSLVFRETNIRSHLSGMVHMKLPRTERKEELDRLLRLMPDESEWYSYQDKFLYSYPGGCPE